MITHLLNYLSSNNPGSITYHKSDMVLHAHSDASYLSVPRSRSRIGGFFFLASSQHMSTHINGPVHCEACVIRNVLTSAAEAEIHALFHNTKVLLPLRKTLSDLGHPQQPTPIQTDNKVSASFTNDTLKKRKLKTIAMNIYWIQDQQALKLINVFW